MGEQTEFFPPRPAIYPKIYAYRDTNPEFDGYLKIGYTTRDVEKRVAEQYPTKSPDGVVRYEIVLEEPAMRADGRSFTDHDVHHVLEKMGVRREGGEWFRCTKADVRSAILSVRTGDGVLTERTESFEMRPEQKEAVEKTADYFSRFYEDNSIDRDDEYAPKARFLWNCKMRFGKTFAAYELAKKMDFKRVLILTFKPAVKNAWREDLLEHVDFEGWQFVTRPDFSGDALVDEQYEKADKSRPIVCFGSFQDFLSYDRSIDAIRIKDQNKWVHTEHWDLVIFDEYHFGAWTDKAKSLFEPDDEDSFESAAQKNPEKFDRGNAYDETYLPITSDYYLYLSGTPFRAINTGEFIEDQIYNWTYSDEQRAKQEWETKIESGKEKPGSNPYASMPRMVMMTYRIPDSILDVASLGQFDEFDLNEFFAAEGKGKDAKFKHEQEVQKWLDLIRGELSIAIVDDLKLRSEKPAMPYCDVRLLNILQHTLWFLPNVASCFAMANLLSMKQNVFYHDYEINVCAGPGAGIGSKALEPVRRSMADPLKTKTITLSCGKLTTGVTVRPWTGIFMLRNLSSPETYFQAAFRVQSPWEAATDAVNLTKKEIIKKECYVFDFAIDRALKQISDYSCRLDLHESNPEKKVSDFIKFLPVIAYDGSAMKPISASEILDLVIAGTSATLLARRWESALLVNVDNKTLSRLLANEEAMAAIGKIEGFRNLNSDIVTIINKSNEVKKIKTRAEERNEPLTQKEKKELTDAQKEYKSKRKEIQKKLIKFAARIPIFMYLTDYREMALTDVIRTVEPSLFTKVTGLDVKDFDLLVSIGLFDEGVMNEAVYKFRRYEDASLTYTGIDKHRGEKIGGWNTVISETDYANIFSQKTTADDLYAGSGKIGGSEKTGGSGNTHLYPEPIGGPFANMTDAPKYGIAAESKEPYRVGPDNENVGPEKTGSEKTGSENPVSETGQTQNTQYAGIASAALSRKKKPLCRKATENEISEIGTGSRVCHRAFGIGTILSFDGTGEEKKICVRVNGHERYFKFPSAFEKGILLLPERDE